VKWIASDFAGIVNDRVRYGPSRCATTMMGCAKFWPALHRYHGVNRTVFGFSRLAVRCFRRIDRGLHPLFNAEAAEGPGVVLSNSVLAGPFANGITTMKQTG
jgi:hypothetical protein